jgi:glycogen debranching enzyme
MKALKETAESILRANDRETFTVPAGRLYPHQWLWDSAFSAIGWAHLDVKRAEKEIIRLLQGQWHNGMIPHMIFDMKPQYARDRNAWRSWEARYSPNQVATSGITQPPVIAEAVQRIGLQLSKADRQIFYKRVLPRLTHYHEWLYAERDPHEQGIVFQIHPYETGFDNTPSWMVQLHEHSKPWWISSIEVLKLDKAINKIRRDTRSIHADQRMENIDALVSWDIIRRLRRKHYDIEKILHRSLFVIQDIGFNSMFVRNNTILREIAKESRIKLPAELLEKMKQTEAAFEHLWDETLNLYFSRDFVNNKLIQIPTVASLLPLYAGTISKERAEKLVSHMQNEQAFWPKFPLPSVPKNSRYFDKRRYWQGPSWINTNWMVIDGLKRMGFENEAAALKSHTVEMLRENGIWEYYDPQTGEGLGSPDFSWSAALALDLLSD